MLAAIVETSLFGYAVIDASFTFRYVSPSLADQVGRSVDELVGTNGLDLIHPDDRELAALAVMEHLDSDGRHDDYGVPVSLRALHGSGGVVALEIGALDLLDHPDIAGVVVRTRPMRGLEFLNEGMRLLAQGAPTRRVLAELVAAGEGIIEDGVGLIAARDRNRSWSLPDDVDPVLALLADTDGGVPELWRRAEATREVQAAFVDEMEPAIASTARAAGFEACWVVPVPHLPIEAQVVIWRTTRRSPRVTSRLELGRVADVVGLAIERDRAIRELEHAARTDHLTGLANRSALHDTLERELERCAATGDSGVGLLFVDLDGFKAVNDRHSHHAGDEALTVVAERVRQTVRASDVVGRLGGDEFAVLCREPVEQFELEAMASRVVEAITAPIELDGHHGLAHAGAVVKVGASVGVALARPEWIARLLEAGISPGDRLLNRADRAMYEAKRSGGSVRFLHDDLSGES